MSPSEKSRSAAPTPGKARLAVATLAALSLTTAGCVTDPNTGHRHVSRAAIGVGVGVVGGILLGGVLGGAGGRIIGAGIGGVVGGSIGYTMDKQYKELREKTEGTGIAIAKVDDNKAILVSLPDGVTFDIDSYMLRPEFQSTLSKIAESLRAYPNSLVDVYGHTDSTGTPMHNQTLSEYRARAVADFLSIQGVSPARIRAQGFAATYPVADNATLEGRARNRRVEIKIVPVSDEQVRAARAASGQ